jgi:hypothetical protein
LNILIPPKPPKDDTWKPKGGKRKGAGRKKGTIEKVTLAKMAIAERVFDYVHQKTGETLVDLWFPLVTHDHPLVRIKALSYMTDRLEGKARETIVHEGTIKHQMTDEEREQSRKVLEKLLPEPIEIKGDIVQ